MYPPNHNLRISGFDALDTPESICAELPADDYTARVVREAREELQAALNGNDPRLVVICGPCSVHDPEAALEYARKLNALRKQVADRMILVMRVYFEKPRTTVGWKGLINDPHLDGSCAVNEGLRRARKLLLEINGMGLPCATEFLDPIVPQYISDLIAWTAIGARTTESQTHREMASGLSMPVGFKNATDGDLQIALDGMVAAQHPHAFLGMTHAGNMCVVRTKGNQDVHVVMRGGSQGPNYAKPHLAYAQAALERFGTARRLIMVDCSHGNSNKDHRRQPSVFNTLLETHARGEVRLLGMMLESNLVEGRQNISDTLTYGQSITDACIDWAGTEKLLLNAHQTLGGFGQAA